jgi:alkyldihydroxyacetonephosphate synthase
MVVGFEGDPAPVKEKARGAVAILKRHGGFNLGASVGKTWSKDKFNIPYLRDYIMDWGCMADVAETSTTWSRVVPLYRAVVAAAERRFAEEVGKGYIGCHISHTYPTGACLYFTWAMKNRPGEELEQYYRMKRFVTDTIVENGGTVSHHHAIGTEHMPWMTREIGETGIRALRAMKSALDPKGICNPGKVLPPVERTAARRPAETAAEATL